MAAVGVFMLTLGLLPLAASSAQGQTNDYPTYEDYPGTPGNIIERDADDGLPATDRFRGTGRHDTAGQIGTDDQTVVGDGFRDSDEAIIARADDFPDSLAGAYVSGLLDAPILLVDTSGAINEDTEAALEVIDPETVTVLGGTSAVSQQAASDAAAVGSQSSDVNRLSGSTRFETAEDIAGANDVAEHDGERTAFLATGEEFADALVAGQLSFQGHPILLTQPDELHSAAERAIDDNDVEHVIILGGTSAVSAAVESEVQDQGVSTERVGDADRAGTATMVAQLAVDEFGFDVDHLNVATGQRFPDALTISPHAGKEQSALFLTRGTTFLDGAANNDTQPSEFLEANACDTQSIHLAGGTNAISHDLEDEIRAHSQCPPPDDGSISGTVTNSGTEQPVPEATLELANDEVETTTTNVDGEYSFDPVAPGDYDLTADAEGKQPETREVTVGDGEDVTEDFVLDPVGPQPETITVEVVPETQTVGETVTATAVVTGDGTDPLEGATVEFTTEHSEGGTVEPEEDTVETGPAGEATFDFTTEDVGTVTVTASTDGLSDTAEAEFIDPFRIEDASGEGEDDTVAVTYTEALLDDGSPGAEILEDQFFLLEGPEADLADLDPTDGATYLHQGIDVTITDAAQGELEVQFDEDLDTGVQYTLAYLEDEADEDVRVLSEDGEEALSPDSETFDTFTAPELSGEAVEDLQANDTGQDQDFTFTVEGEPIGAGDVVTIDVSDADAANADYSGASVDATAGAGTAVFDPVTNQIVYTDVVGEDAVGTEINVTLQDVDAAGAETGLTVDFERDAYSGSATFDILD